MEIGFLINEERKDYKCFDVLKRFMETNKEFRDIILEGYAEGKVSGFSEEMWKKIGEQNVRTKHSFEEHFVVGFNEGACSTFSRQLSYSYGSCYICGGVLPLLAGTKNCVDGSHTWISHHGKIIDTTLMLVIDEDYAKKLGYVEENRYNPNVDENYRATKEFTNDPNLRAKK